MTSTSSSCYSVNFTAAFFNPNKPLTSPQSGFTRLKVIVLSIKNPPFLSSGNLKLLPVFWGKAEPLRIMISGAPASGKGTQCELITKKIDGSLSKQEIFSQIDSVLTELLEKKEAALAA